MSQQPILTEHQLQKLLQSHDERIAAFRAELAKRTPARVRYDDYLLEQLRMGKRFKFALRKSNAKFPAEALTVTPQNFFELRLHYTHFMSTERVDDFRRKLEKCNDKIRVDEKISALLREMIPTKNRKVDKLAWSRSVKN